ncbi:MULTISPECIES: D-ornithine 4,5-aminomutase subunit OraE [unclassified Streptomyces]|uniref:D-ornithine 4,5-aminomutase subunit OraE n=1 Tax=Streptomyces sp. NPDC127532 TaxID=3345399 RepID=UPI0036354094
MTPDERLLELRSQPVQHLKERFWGLTRKIIGPLSELAATHTTPSIERSVLLRMGFSSQEAQALVSWTVERGLLSDGVARLLKDRTDALGCDPRQAVSALLKMTLEPPRSPAAACPTLQVGPEEPLPIDALLKDLASYRPRRKGWRRRDITDRSTPFRYQETSKDLNASIALQAADYFDGADPQPDCVITSEIASGRFEDDLRRMRMAAWHGADHIMVIRTLGQSHIDGLLEGTPEGIGGVPITRKQLRATRRTLDLIEEEVGRPINLHSYVSGLASSEMAVLFAEEGVSGAHQDCQYNILYRNVNPVRSVVDAFEAKRVLAQADILQLDGAHNANSTALKAWNVRPELLIQHALNCVMSELAGMSKERIALSTVPPTAPPAPKLALDLPYAVALRYLFEGYVFRAQQNTRYSTTNLHEATVLHSLDTLISRLTSADIQSTISPDEARCVPWHYTSVQAVAATKQNLIGLDGLRNLVNLNQEAMLPDITDLIARAVLMLEDALSVGGYFSALEQGFFVDSGLYPDREGDAIRRSRDGGVGADTVVPRSERYIAPVCAHYGRSTQDLPCPGCTLCDERRLPNYVDELDETDNVSLRRAERNGAGDSGIRPEAEHRGDGRVTVSMFLPVSGPTGDSAALRFAERMNLEEPQIVDRVVLHPGEGTQYEIVGRTTSEIARDELPAASATVVVPPAEHIRSVLSRIGTRVVGGTLGNDEHSVGLQEVMNIKHRGLEWFGVRCTNIGSSISIERLLDEAVERGAHAVLASVIVSHGKVHELMMRKLNDVAVERGLRQRLVLIGGGPQVTSQLAQDCGLDAGFGRGTEGIDVAHFLADTLAGTDPEDPHLQ